MDYRADFPIFRQDKFHYMDSAASSQKPISVIDGIKDYYCNYNGNAGRGSHDLAIKSEELIEDARIAVQRFIGAANANEIVFTKNATESLNIIAFAYAMNFLKEGDEILIPVSNHHANLVTWQQVALKTRAKLVYIEIDENGDIDMDDFKNKLSENTKILAFSYVVNTTGVVNPAKELIGMAKSVGAITVLDAAQSICHLRHDVKDLGAEFMVFSGHKMFSGFGVGVLYAKEGLLKNAPALLFGGEMIEFVERLDSTFRESPHRYEGGTMNAAAIHSLKLAIDYIESIGIDEIRAHTDSLAEKTRAMLRDLKYVDVYNEGSRQKSGIVAFNVRGVHSHDTAYVLNDYGVHVRSGNHCTQPLMKSMGVQSSVRSSFQIYNDETDILALKEGLERVIDIFLDKED